VPHVGPLIRLTVVDRVVDVVRDEVLRGRIPSGSALREEQVAEWVGASRHTVRAALQRLVAERVLVASPYRGVRVAEVDPEQVRGLQQLRAALESEAVRIANERFDGRWPRAATRPAEVALGRLSRLAADGSDDWLAVERAHAEFHQALVEASGSPRIIDAHAALESELLLFLLQVKPHYSLDTLVDEHRELLEEVQRRGSDAVHDHLEHSLGLLLGDHDAGGGTDHVDTGATR